eukprot:3934839-Rhodomonas_salina.1
MMRAVVQAAITFRSAVSLPMTNKDSRELYNEVEEMAKDLAKNAPEGMQSMFQVSAALIMLSCTVASEGRFGASSSCSCRCAQCASSSSCLLGAVLCA